MKSIQLFAVALCILIAGSVSKTEAQNAQQVVIDKVYVCGDNVFRFGWGDANGVTTLEPRQYENAGQIFDGQPELGPFTLTCPEYIYIVSWRDQTQWNGVLVECHSGNSIIRSGHGDWEVYATGEGEAVGPFSFWPGPTKATVNNYIQIANNNNGAVGDTSKGWVKANGHPQDGLAHGRLEIGRNCKEPGMNWVHKPWGATQDNKPFLEVTHNAFQADSKWMWYNPDVNHFDGSVAGKSPFYAQALETYKDIQSNPQRGHVLIFRIPVATIACGGSDPGPGPGPGGNQIADCGCEDCKELGIDVKTDITTAVPASGNGSAILPASINATAAGGLSKVSATIISSVARSCNGSKFHMPVHVPKAPNLADWNGALLAPEYSSGVVWCAKKGTADFPGPRLPIQMPPELARCADTVMITVKYTFWNKKCEACEVIQTYQVYFKGSGSVLKQEPNTNRPIRNPKRPPLIKDLELPVRPRPRPGTPDKPREPSSDEPGISVLKPKLIKP